MKYSKQRDRILKELGAVYTHPTASQVYDMVRVHIPSISLGTVYRNLAALSEGGIIQRITTGDGSERFDANAEPHYHFCCTTCGSVIDVDLPVMAEVERLCEARTGATVERHSLVLYGTCASCKKTEH